MTKQAWCKKHKEQCATHTPKPLGQILRECNYRDVRTACIFMVMASRNLLNAGGWCDAEGADPEFRTALLDIEAAMKHADQVLASTELLTEAKR